MATSVRKVPVAVRLPIPLANRLAEAARKRHKRKSDLLREAIEQYLSP